jgi:hypothetical protein
MTMWWIILALLIIGCIACAIIAANYAGNLVGILLEGVEDTLDSET